MIWYILAGTATLAAYAFLIRFTHEGLKKFSWAALGRASAIAFGILFVLFMVAVVADSTVANFSKHSYSYSYDLEALQDGTSTRGMFFLGSGIIDQTPKYTYYVARDGGYFLESWPAQGTKITYGPGNPQVTYHVRKNTPGLWTTYSKTTIDSVEFQIPSGSIYKDYTLDANN